MRVKREGEAAAFSACVRGRAGGEAGERACIMRALVCNGRGHHTGRYGHPGLNRGGLQREGG